MLAFIRGQLRHAQPGHVILEASGIGYFIHIPASIYPDLAPLDSELLLHTSYVVREQSQTLYGFLTLEERDLFEVLLGVSSIGPKTALSVLGHLNAYDLGQAIANANTAVICKVPGIGRKTAERLILEIRDKLPGLGAPSGAVPSGVATTPVHNSKVSDAMSALINLGYSQAIAEKALKKTLASADEEQIELGQLITSALQNV